MKKIILTVAALLAAATMANAASIVNSAHDLGQSIYGDTTQTNEICVFCHTPHNAVKNVPLWNRINPSAATFELYNSVTLTAAAQGARLYDDSISLFCMSCHDGITKMGAIKNLPGAGTTANPYAAQGDKVNQTPFGSGLGTIYAAISNDGQSLKNDHPIGFSYATAASTDQSESMTGGLHTVAEVKSAFGIVSGSVYTPFYKANNGVATEQMECASCHRVHDPGPSFNFLRIENSRSALCLACHVK